MNIGETAEDAEKTEELDPELEEMKRRVQEMEDEAKKLSDLQSQVEKDMGGALSAVNKEELDARSVFVGNVDFAATPEELQAHFQSCGTVNRITILCDKFTGHPKGFAYIEFVDKDSVANAMVLNESLFRGRQLKVTSKRTNVPSFMRGGGGRGFRARGFRGYRGRPYMRGRGRAAYYHPYGF